MGDIYEVCKKQMCIHPWSFLYVRKMEAEAWSRIYHGTRYSIESGGSSG